LPDMLGSVSIKRVVHQDPQNVARPESGGQWLSAG
jgi:hypothetical protein